MLRRAGLKEPRLFFCWYQFTRSYCALVNLLRYRTPKLIWKPDQRVERPILDNRPIDMSLNSCKIG